MMDGQLEFNWSAEPEKPATPLFPVPDVLPVDPEARGYRGFRAEREAAIRGLEQRFGLILDKPVRLTLVDTPGEYTGTLRLADLIPDARSPGGLRLRLGRTEFSAHDIESCVRID
jgi:hypothetical protein